MGMKKITINEYYYIILIHIINIQYTLHVYTCMYDRLLCFIKKLRPQVFSRHNILHRID